MGHEAGCADKYSIMDQIVQEMKTLGPNFQIYINQCNNVTFSDFCMQHKI